MTLYMVDWNVECYPDSETIHSLQHTLHFLKFHHILEVYNNLVLNGCTFSVIFLSDVLTISTG